MTNLQYLQYTIQGMQIDSAKYWLEQMNWANDMALKYPKFKDEHLATYKLAEQNYNATLSRLFGSLTDDIIINATANGLISNSNNNG